MTVLQIVYDPKYGCAVPDARVQRYVESVVARWKNSTDNFCSVIIGTDVMLSAFHLYYLHQLLETGEAPSMVFFEDDRPMEMTKCGSLHQEQYSIAENLGFNIMDARAKLTEPRDNQ